MKFSVITATYNQLPYLKKIKRYWEKQTFRDFEWILAIDGSTDGTWEWAKKEKIKAIGNKKNKNYDWSLYNRAVKEARGEYITFVMGDSYPKEDYLEWMAKFVRLKRVLSGLRMNVTKNGNFISWDWRKGGITDEMELVACKWDNLTLNTLTLSKKLYQKVGGIYEGYKGYGRADLDLQIRLELAGADLWVVAKAIVYHIGKPKRIEDTPHNIKLFDKRMKELKWK